MVIKTRILLGSRDSPRFVSKEFYECMNSVVAAFAIRCILHPTTIIYNIPRHMVVERSFSQIDKYDIHLDDTTGIPRCRRTRELGYSSYKRKTPCPAFDRFHWLTEETYSNYFLLTPDAMFFNTSIYTDWNSYHVIYHDVVWKVHFRKVYVDPYDTSETIWFHGQPRYQVELECFEDFRHREQELKRAVLSILPRAFRWE
jgi:hypothetical protein